MVPYEGACMKRLSLAPILVAIIVAGIFGPASAWAQGASDFGGRWTLNRELSQFPREIGFSVSWALPGGPDSSASGGRGRSGSSGGGAGAFTAPRESEDDARRMQRLTAEVRNPYSRAANPSQLIVDVQFIERGGGDEVKRIYEPSSAHETVAAVTAAPSPSIAKAGAGLPAVGASESGRAGVPASAGGLPAQTFNQQPDAPL